MHQVPNTLLWSLAGAGGTEGKYLDCLCVEGRSSCDEGHDELQWQRSLYKIRLGYYFAAANTSQEECSVVEVKCQPVDDEILCETWDFDNAVYTDLCLFFYVLLNVHLSIFISVINQLDAPNLFYNKFISCLYMFRTPCAHRQEVKNCIIQHLVSSHL